MIRSGLARLLQATSAAAPLATSELRCAAQAAAARQLWQRQYSAGAADEEQRDPFSNERVAKLAEEILQVCMWHVMWPVC